MILNHFFEHDGRYRSKRIGFIALSLSILWLAFAITFIVLSLQKGGIFEEWYWVIGLAAFVYQIRLFAQQVDIDVNRRTISKSYLGLLKKEIHVSDIKKFRITEHRYMSLHNGTDISIDLNNGKSVSVLERIGKKKNVEGIYDEIRQLISA